MMTHRILPDGIIVPLPTPLTNFDKIDLEGLDNLINYLIQEGVSGISILGSIGEERCIDYVTRKTMISETCRIVDGRIPVLVSISDTSFNESYLLSGFASECGVAAMVISPPYYLTTGQAEILEYFGELLKVICLPIILCNVESATNIKIAPSTILELVKYNKIVGLKNSLADIIYLKRLMDNLRVQRPEFKLYFGKEEDLFETTMLGGNGGFAGGANLFPKLYIRLYDAIKHDDFATYKALQSILMDIRTNIFSIGHYHSSYLKGIKCALNVMEIIRNDYMVPPFNKFNEPEREKIENGINRIKEKLRVYGI